MRKFFKIAMSVVISLTLVFSLMACKISNDKGGGGGSDDLVDNPNATKSLTVSTLTDSDEYNTMVRWANAYMRLHEDTQINVQNEMSSMSIVATWSNNEELDKHDIIWTAGDQHSYWSSLGYFEDLSKYAVDKYATFFDDFYSALIESTHIKNTDEGIWFMPRDYNQLTVLVNTDLFAQAQMSVPSEDWTWDDLETLCKKWREKYPAKSSLAKYPLEVDYSWNPFSVTMMNNFGACVYDKNGAFAAESSKMEAYMNYMNGFINTNKYISASSTAGSFTALQSPMLICVRPALTACVNTDMNLKALPFPATKTIPGSKTTSNPNGISTGNNGYVGAGCSGYAISSKSKNKDLAWQFLTFCMSETGYNAVGDLGTIAPALTTLKNSGTWAEYSTTNGDIISTTAFTSSLAEPISVNFCSNLQPSNQAKTTTALMTFMKSLSYTPFNYNSSIAQLKSTIGSLT